MESPIDIGISDSDHKFHTLSDASKWSSLLTQQNVNSSSLNIIHLNIRSIRKNWNQLEVFLEEILHCTDIVVLTEVNIKDEEANLYALHGFTVYSKLRKHKSGGGILIYIKNYLLFDLIEPIEIQINSFEFLAGTINLPFGKKISLIAIYRPPDLDKNLFLDELDRLIVLIEKSTELVIIGDININILGSNNKLAMDYEDMLAANGLENCIHDYTRQEIVLGKLVQSSIDHIFVRSSKSTEVNAAVITTKISDHYAIALNLNNTKLIKSNTYVISDNITIKNEKAIEYKLKSYDWSHLLQSEDPVILYDKLCEIFRNIYDTSNHTLKVNKRTQKRWITKEIIKCCRERDILFAKWKHCHVHNSTVKSKLRKEYSKCRNDVNRQIMRAKQEFYKNKFNSIKNDLKGTWKEINDIVGKQSKSSVDDIIIRYMGKSNSPDCIANEFAHSFINETEAIRHQCNIEICNYEHSRALQSMYFPEVSCKFVTQTIMSMDKTKSPGKDGIRVQDLQNIVTEISPVITKLINLTIRTGKIPDTMKVSIIRPIYKSGDHCLYNNYRAVAILPSIEKIMEEYTAFCLVKYLEKNKILTDMQFGFRKKMSTTMLLQQFSDWVNEKLNFNNHVVALFIDFSKAFDTLRFDKLMDALSNIGIRGPVFDWFLNYLTNRKLIVKVKGSFSKILKFSSGVPQGSILGPTLYLIYVNEMVNVLSESKIFMYADDTAMLTAHMNLDEAEAIMQKEFNKIVRFTHDKGLVINAKKTKVIHIRTCKQYSRNIKIIFHNCLCLALGDILNCNCNNVLENVHHIKYLGIQIDCHMRWDVHIEELRKRLRSCSYKMYQLKPYLSLGTLKTVYTALAESLILYGVQVWGHAAETHISKITKLQKQILRSMLPQNVEIQSVDLFNYFNVLSVKLLFQYKIYLQYYFSNEYKMYQIHSYSTRKTEYLIPRFNNNYGKSTLCVTVPILFNKLPPQLRQLKNMKIIKYELKKWLLSE